MTKIYEVSATRDMSVLNIGIYSSLQKARVEVSKIIDANIEFNKEKQKFIAENAQYIDSSYYWDARTDFAIDFKQYEHSEEYSYKDSDPWEDWSITIRYTEIDKTCAVEKNYVIAQFTEKSIEEFKGNLDMSMQVLEPISIEETKEDN